MAYSVSQFPDLIGVARSNAESCFHRQILVLSGARLWAYRLLSLLTLPQPLRYGDIDSDLEDYNRAWKKQFLQKQLGQEFQTIVFDGYQGFDPDLFSAMTGTLRGGGLCFLITPPLETWSQFDDPDYRKICVHPYTAAQITKRFLGRLARLLEADSHVALIRQCSPCSDEYEFRQAVHCADASSSDQLAAFADQQQCVTQLIAVAKSSAAVAVLMADRGRGKSAALGIAAAKLMQSGFGNILITAPGKDAVGSLLQHYRAITGCEYSAGSALRYADSQLRFVTPDALLADLGSYAKNFQLLLVDEAAAIPNYRLQQLHETFPRIVFSTTVHGYEGSGRSFALRFLDHLRNTSSNFHSLSLSLPIRWAADDPLEQWLNESFCFGGRAANTNETITGSIVRFTELNREVLSADEKLLQGIFALLVNAHYRTRPSDLRQLLDAPNVRIFILQSGQVLLGVIMLSMEGGFDAALARAISTGKRRPQGHLLPQSLCVQCGIDDVLSMRAARIMRIAVAPQQQRAGFGSRLLQELQLAMQEEAVDYLGTSFGAYQPLVKFWQRNDYHAVSLGTRKDATSGEFSLLMVQMLSDAARVQLLPRVQQFHDDLAITKNEFYPQLDEKLLAQFKNNGFLNGAASTTDDRLQVRRFVTGERQYDYCFASLYRFLQAAGQERMAQLDEQQHQLLEKKIVKNRSWSEVAQQLQLPGRRGVIAALRESFASLLEASAQR